MRAAVVAFLVLRFGLRLELGPEFDSNANHAEDVSGPSASVPGGPVSSFLVRGVARGKLLWASAPHALRLTLDLGGKWFFAPAAGPQNVVVGRLALDERTTLSPHAALGFGFDYHDASQFHDCPDIVTTDGRGNPLFTPDTSCHRDFRLAAARAQTIFSGEVPALALEAAARYYQWKPDGDVSFLGVGGAVTPSLRFHGGDEDDPRDVVLSAAGRVEYRSYAGPALRFAGDFGDPSQPRRHDVVATGSLTLSWAGPLLASAGYLVEGNRSSSFGGSYVYQAVTLGLTTPLPGKLVAAMRAQLLFFASGALPTALAVEDENRNALVFDVSRELGAGFTLHARYSVFRNAGGDLAGPYLRQLVFAGATYETR